MIKLALLLLGAVTCTAAYIATGIVPLAGAALFFYAIERAQSHHD